MSLHGRLSEISVLDGFVKREILRQRRLQQIVADLRVPDRVLAKPPNDIPKSHPAPRRKRDIVDQHDGLPGDDGLIQRQREMAERQCTPLNESKRVAVGYLPLPEIAGRAGYRYLPEHPTGHRICFSNRGPGTMIEILTFTNVSLTTSLLLPTKQ